MKRRPLTDQSSLFTGERFPRKLLGMMGACTLAFGCASNGPDETTSANALLRPYAANPSYWQYKGRPVMLLGANQTDSPYLLPDPEAYFEQLTSHGGNYCRYVVKQRLDPGLLQIFPFKKLTDGRYDLNAWNDEYWDRFEEGLKTTRDLNIVVQMELWDRFPFAWQPPALGVPDIWVNHVIDHPELYSFCAFQFQTIIVGGQGHYDRLAEVHEWVQAAQSGPRPVNAVKIFAHTELLPTDVGLENEPNAQTRYWRPLMAGWAALSLHREPDEAYLLAHPGKAYGIYFPTTGSVQVNLGGPVRSSLTLQWINIETGAVHGEPESFRSGPVVTVRTPDSGSDAGWAATLVVNTD